MWCVRHAVVVVEEGVEVEGCLSEEGGQPRGKLEKASLQEERPHGEAGGVLAEDEQHHKGHRLVVQEAQGGVAEQSRQGAAVGALDVEAEGLVGQEEDDGGGGGDRNLAGLADRVREIGLETGGEEGEPAVGEVVRQQDVAELCHCRGEGDPERVGRHKELRRADKKSGGDAPGPGRRHHSAAHDQDLMGGGVGGSLFAMQAPQTRAKIPQASVVDIAARGRKSEDE